MGRKKKVSFEFFDVTLDNESRVGTGDEECEGESSTGTRRPLPSSAHICHQTRLRWKKRKSPDDEHEESHGALYCVTAQGEQGVAELGSFLYCK